MKKIASLPKLAGARVIVRVDYNVPMKTGKILDDRRIVASFPTIDAVLKKGGTPVLLAHLGDGAESLRPVAKFLSRHYGIVFIDRDVTDPKILDILALVPAKTIVLLENIRRYPGETANDPVFSRALARLGSYYVNDAFSVSHRAHASVVGIPKLLPSFAGHQLASEVAALSSVLEHPAHRFVFILGGAKFETKIPLLARFAKSADSLVIAGAILNNFYKVAGFPVGKSVVEAGFDKPIRALLKNPKLLLPVDVIVLRGSKKLVLTPDEVRAGDTIVDIGAQSVALIARQIKTAKLIVWNGPTGWYERGFSSGTVELARAIASSKARAIIGGGDTGAVIEKVIGTNKRIFVSTGGGATLEYLAKGKLPGITALR